LVQPSEETVLEFYLDTVSTTCGSGWVNHTNEPQRRLTPSKKPDTFKTYLDNSPVSPH
jgi:hypothetical protein